MVWLPPHWALTHHTQCTLDVCLPFSVPLPPTNCAAFLRQELTNMCSAAASRARKEQVLTLRHNNCRQW